MAGISAAVLVMWLAGWLPFYVRGKRIKERRKLETGCDFVCSLGGIM